MKKQEMICIGCPLGCMMTVTMKEGDVKKVEGHTCKRGEDYARKECVNPTRILTTSVMVNRGIFQVVSVKTACDVPKDKIMDCIIALKGLKIEAPVRIGDVILPDVAGTKVSIVATRNVDRVI